MRRIIAALVVSVDGFIEGPNEELDWVETWEDPFDLLPQIDTCILGRGMYPQYEQYWEAILANPNGILPVTGKTASKGEIEYTYFAHTTPHFVVSKTLDPTQRSVIGSHDVATIIDRGSPRDAAGNVIATNTLERCIA
jgi:dihydrofolate reductase